MILIFIQFWLFSVIFLDFLICNVHFCSFSIGQCSALFCRFDADGSVAVIMRRFSCHKNNTAEE